MNAEYCYGEVYLKQNLATIESSPEPGDLPTVVKFHTHFLPTARDIVPCYQDDECQYNMGHAQLTEYLKFLLQNNHETGNMGMIKISGKLKWHTDHKRRLNNDGTGTLRYEVSGTFPYLMTQFCPDAGVLFDVHIHNLNLFDGKCKLIQKTRTAVYPDVDCDDVGNSTNDFTANATTQEIVVGGLPRAPKLDVVMYGSTELLKRFSEPVLIIGPTGRGYELTPTMKELIDRRKLQVTERKETDVKLVGGSGREFPVIKQFLVNSSPVFMAMMENKSFVEGQTQTIKLPEVKDELIEALIGYLYYYELDVCCKDVDVAVEMLQVAEGYQVEGLINAIRDMLLNRPGKDFETGQLLQLLTFCMNLEHLSILSRKCLTVLKDRLGESGSFSEFFQGDLKLGQELFRFAVKMGDFTL